jgi:outer membrane receptor protein involved in Fe transport
MVRLLRNVFFVMASSLPMLAGAQGESPRRVDVSAGDLVTALDTLARQSGAQFIYQADQLKGHHSPGAHGMLSTDDALRQVLAGSGFGVRRDASGAMVIVRNPAPRKAPASSRTGSPGGAAAAATPEATTRLQEVVVTGSRIPRAELEGPAPVVTITAREIQNRGFSDVPALMTSLTQNLGSLDNNQQTDGFSPGAQAVDLRGLGPNHTLVLVNGRRIADYPQSYNGNSNFTDISNLPLALIERVEILSGSASAVYGSDAISGVINFILKKKIDDTTLNVRVGDTQHGGGASQRVQFASGFSSGKFDSIFALEVSYKQPLWAYQRSFTDSRLDSPVDPSRNYPSQVWVRMDEDENYIDPGQATCNTLSSYDRGSIVYGHRRNWGNYCGSYKDVGYGTLENGRRAANFYGSASYRLNDHAEVFLDVLAGTSHQESYNTPLQWQNSYQLNGDSTPIPFYNQATGQVEQWQRRYFTIEENGGFGPGKIRNINNTLSLNTGVKGSLGADSNWNYEAMFGHSQNQLEMKWPALVSARAQALYLGPSLGVDPDSGYQIYDAPVSRLYTPLTVAQFRSITQDSIDHDKSRSENLSLTVNNTEVLQLPAGPLGFAGVAEHGNQYFGLKADPLSLDGTYFGLHNTDAVGSRSHSGVGVEFSVPVFSQLTLTSAGRYDNYSYSSTSAGKFTYSLGLEYRPFKSLLLRGSLGTGFRAPDLSYLYAGISGSSSGGTDYYLCRRDEADTAPDFADDCSNGDIGFNGRSHGSTALKDETSKSFTYGFVYSPIPELDITADYYNIKLKNEVEYQGSDEILRREADCRLGVTTAGAPVDINSSVCQEILSQVVRNAATASFNPEGVTSVLVLPINAARDYTSGVDFNSHYRLATDRFGNFVFSLGATYVAKHTIQLSADSPVDNQLTDLYYYVIPRSKANYSVSWNFDKFTAALYGARLGGLPNYDGTQRLGPTFMYNATFNYQFSPRLTATFTVDNLFDTRPGKDDTWTSYPYYASRWFSPVGRSFFAELNYRFGGND